MAVRGDVDSWVRRLRIGSGLVLFSFTTTHLINHAFGLISYEAAEAARRTALGSWHTDWGSSIVLAALFVHVGATLTGLARRRSLLLPAWQLAQIGLGLAIPFLLVIHILSTRGMDFVHGVRVNYYLELWLLWPGLAVRQIILVLLVWLHGCLGIHYWLRSRSFYRPLRPWLLALAVLLPTLSITGFISGGRDIHRAVSENPGLLETWAETFHWVPPSETTWVFETQDIILALVGCALLAAIAFHLAARLLGFKRRRIRVTYDDGTEVNIPPGTSVLEASMIGRVPHASICGGRGRCSTCRVRITRGQNQLPHPQHDELRVLRRLDTPRHVRLACQLRPTADLSVTRLIPTDAMFDQAMRKMSPRQGLEREIAVLFVDLRGFTRISEGRLPYDVVYVLNRYFRAMGKAIESEGGMVDKFIGDGIMALFGVSVDGEVAARQALAATRRMGEALELLNRSLGDDLPEGLRMGIGLHIGPAIIGEMGYGHATALTAIGDTVNVASRLEAATKELGVELLVSDEVMLRAGFDNGEGEPREIAIRGRNGPARVRAFDHAVDAPLLEAPGFPADDHGIIPRVTSFISQVRTRINRYSD
ncbi:MAG: adenylate/guanylate cyclase domain-containing protein [Geminicoccaceae bacterium]|nr:adenylate/guanylate cyclase domain-containing protein [Geminicoccaceae bacterium]